MQIECKDKKKALKAVNKNKNGILRYCSAELKNDKDVCMAALNKFGNTEYKFISYNLKNDKDIQILYLNKGGDIYDIVLTHKEVCLYAIEKKRSAASRLSTEMKSDKDVCMALVSRNGSDLYYCSMEMRDDRDVCLAAIKQNVSAFVHCSDKMKADPDICLIAAQSNDKNVMKSIPEELKANIPILAASVSSYLTTSLAIPDMMVFDEDELKMISLKRKVLLEILKTID